MTSSMSVKVSLLPTLHSVLAVMGRDESTALMADLNLQRVRAEWRACVCELGKGGGGRGARLQLRTHCAAMLPPSGAPIRQPPSLHSE